MSGHPNNPDAVKVVRDGPRGWHWVAAFDPAVHVLYVEPSTKAAPPKAAPEPETVPTKPAAPARNRKAR